MDKTPNYKTKLVSLVLQRIIFCFFESFLFCLLYHEVLNNQHDPASHYECNGAAWHSECSQHSRCCEVDQAGEYQTKEEQEPVSAGVDSALAESIQSAYREDRCIAIQRKSHWTHVCAEQQAHTDCECGSDECFQCKLPVVPEVCGNNDQGADKSVDNINLFKCIDEEQAPMLGGHGTPIPTHGAPVKASHPAAAGAGQTVIQECVHASFQSWIVAKCQQISLEADGGEEPHHNDEWEGEAWQAKVAGETIDHHLDRR